MRICILGATGLVGRESLTLIDRAWPGAELDLYASRDQTLEHAGKALPVQAAARIEQADATGGDLALVALDDANSERYVPRLLELGYRVIDKSNTYRLDPAVPLVVAGVNCSTLTRETKLAANPNCTTIPLTLAIAPLARRWDVLDVTAATYQAISGAGIGTLDEFLAGTRAGYADDNRLGTQLSASGYVGNTVPHNGKTDASGFSAEERKLVDEGRKILGRPQLRVSAQCCRVPVAVGHYINAWIQLGAPPTDAQIVEALTAAPFVRFVPGPEGDGISALHCVAHRDHALVGRVRRDPRDETGRTLCMTIAGDNLRLGAATNAVRAATRWYPSADPELQTPA